MERARRSGAGGEVRKVWMGRDERRGAVEKLKEKKTWERVWGGEKGWRKGLKGGEI